MFKSVMLILIGIIFSIKPLVFVQAQEIDSNYLFSLKSMDTIITNATYETRQIIEYKLKQILPYDRERTILILQNNKRIEIDSFKHYYEKGMYKENRISIFYDIEKIREVTDDPKIRYLVIIK